MYIIAQKCLKRFRIRKNGTVINMGQEKMAIAAGGTSPGLQAASINKGTASSTGKKLSLGLWGERAG
jgi:hypothetical protein